MGQREELLGVFKDLVSLLPAPCTQQLQGTSHAGRKNCCARRSLLPRYFPAQTPHSILLCAMGTPSSQSSRGRTRTGTSRHQAICSGHYSAVVPSLALSLVSSALLLPFLLFVLSVLPTVFCLSVSGLAAPSPVSSPLCKVGGKEG